jgi:hypothetical protein
LEGESVSVAEKIRALCKIRKERWTNMGTGEITYTYDCPSCYEGAKTPDEVKHGEHCVSSLVSLDPFEMAAEVIKRGFNWDYDGGGHNSCPICHAGTGFRGNHIHHKRNCPYPAAKALLSVKAFNEAVEHAF